MYFCQMFHRVNTIHFPMSSVLDTNGTMSYLYRAKQEEKNNTSGSNQ